MDRPAATAFISVSGLTKTFGTTTVLHDVSLDIKAGEVLVLLGPNGAGKSTFLNIVGGTLRPTSGALEIDGEQVDFDAYDGRAARQVGIQRVFQEFSTFANLTVAENLEITSASGARSSARAMIARAERRMKAFPGNRVSVRAEMHHLTVAERQMVEVVRAMTEDRTRLVILDEPTSALSREEARQLAELVRRKAAEGVAIVYVTHKLEEAIELADRIVVLRDGRMHFDGPGKGVTHDQLLELLGAMVEGSKLRRADSVAVRAQDDVLAVTELTAPRLTDVSIRVGSGEIIGIAGLEGAGQRELLQAIFDARGKSKGAIRSTGDIAYVSGDRQREGLLPIWTVEQNVDISAVPKTARLGFVDFAALKVKAQTWLAELGLGHRADSPILALSGGNQQKALLGRALASDAPTLLLDDPTRGVDAGAKAAIYAILEKIKENDRSAILYSTEVAEFQLCDRVYVMARGQIVAELCGGEITEERLVKASFARPGGSDNDAAGNPATSAATSAAVTQSGESGRSTLADALARLVSARAFPAAILMMLMFGIAFWAEPNTFSTFGLHLLLQASLPMAFAVLAQMLFLMGGDIDLGLGFAVGLANVIASTYLVEAPLVGVLALLGLVACYVLMGMIVEILAVSSIVITLGASFIWLGVGLMILEVPGGASPAWLSGFASIRLWPIPLDVFALIAAALIGMWFAYGWRFSTQLRALGYNKRIYKALGYSAVVGRVTLYALSGVFVVIAGLLITATTGGGNVNVASSYTLLSVAAVVVGGASFAGGIVSPTGAIMAIVGMSLITSNLVFLGISSEYSTAIGGIILIVVLSMKALTRPNEL